MRAQSSPLATAICLITYANLALAEDVFWIVSHAPLMASRLDPIVSPGGVSSHVHAVIGGSNFSPLYDYDTSIKSQCTTANVDIDHSNYWVPQLYNKFPNGSLTLAGLSYANTYYQMRRDGEEPVYEFPPGFRMLAGNPNRNTLNLSDSTNAAISYVCLGGTTPQGNEFPKERCSDGMRAQVYFPHCWDGINNWLDGSKHVSYGAEGTYDGGGKCPDSHPKRIMGLFYEFIFHDHMDYAPGNRVWANGDTVGYSLHGDFTNGWPVGTFSDIFSYGQQCSVGFSLENCPALAPHMSKDGGKCKYPGVLVDEDIGTTNLLAKLPGNNPIWPTARSANYVESAKFNESGKDVNPSPTAITSVRASQIKIGTVRGDAPYTIPPDPVSTSSSTAPSSSATSKTASATSSTSSNSALASRSSRTGSSSSKTSTNSHGSTASLVAGNLAGVPAKSSTSTSASTSSADVTAQSAGVASKSDASASSSSSAHATAPVGVVAAGDGGASSSSAESSVASSHPGNLAESQSTSSDSTSIDPAVQTTSALTGSGTVRMHTHTHTHKDNHTHTHTHIHTHNHTHSHTHTHTHSHTRTKAHTSPTSSTKSANLDAPLAATANPSSTASPIAAAGVLAVSRPPAASASASSDAKLMKTCKRRKRRDRTVGQV